MAMNMMNPGLSPAASDLGLGGMLDLQTREQTDELRKKKLLEAQQRGLMGPTASTAVGMLFPGGMGGFGRSL